MEFITELKNIGLKDKEAAVYLACLELGPSPVQVIARKAKVVRATTYVILESLTKIGLVTEYKEGKKTLFAAAPPRQLMRILEKERERIDDKQKELESLLPELQMFVKTTGGRPSARYFDGIEGLRAIRREMMMYSQPYDTWYNFTPTDYLSSIITEEEDKQYFQQRVAKRIKSKIIFTTKSPSLEKKLIHSEYSNQLTERRFVSSKIFSSTAGMTVFRDRIAIGSFTGKIGGVIIESSPMSDMMRCLFDLAWIGAEKVDKKK